MFFVNEYLKLIFKWCIVSFSFFFSKILEVAIYVLLQIFKNLEAIVNVMLFDVEILYLFKMNSIFLGVEHASMQSLLLSV